MKISRSFCTVAALCSCLPASAQSYPSKPIRMIVVSAPGGSTDILARAAARALTEGLRQTLVIDNKPGGGGIIATDTTAKAAPDGYTILLTNTAFAVAPSLHTKLPFDTLRDLAPVSLIAVTHSLLAVVPSLPAKSVKELIELAKSQPGKLNYSAGTTGSAAHLGGELFKLMAGVNIVHVPYPGTAGQVNALLSGEAQMSFITMPSALPHVRSGRLRALAVGGLKRASALPEVPTVDEAGLPGFDVAAWNGLLAPAKTPAPIIARLNTEIVKMTNDPDARKTAGTQGAELESNSPEQFAAYIKTQLVKWGKVVKASGMRPD